MSTCPLPAPADLKQLPATAEPATEIHYRDGQGEPRQAALANEVRNDAVQANTCQQQRYRGKSVE